jgi:ELWxxDGT repeat protein
VSLIENTCATIHLTKITQDKGLYYRKEVMQRFALLRSAPLPLLILLFSIGCSSSGSIESLLSDDTVTPSLSSSVGFDETQLNLVEGATKTIKIIISGEPQLTDTQILLSLSSVSGFNRFMAIPGTVTIPAGQTSIDLQLDTIDDAISQSQQTWTLSMTSVVMGITPGHREVIIVLEDNDSNAASGGATLLKAMNNSPAAINKVVMGTSGRVVYSGTDASHGTEPWISDGTALGSFMLKDTNPGPSSGSPYNFYYDSTNNVVYFSASSPGEGAELWRTDGTKAGTYLVKDINPGTANSGPSFKGQVGAYVIFTAYTPTTGIELWGTNGTSAGTQLLGDFIVGSTGTILTGYMVMGGYIYFGVGKKNVELWKTDGTPAGTSMVVQTSLNSNSYSIDCFVMYGNKLYFRGYDAVNGSQLWSSDGTAIGTTMVMSGYFDACPAVVVRNKLLFRAYTPGWAQHLFFTDGTPGGTQDLGVGPSIASDPVGGFAGTNKYVYFSPATNGYEPWVTDGTLAGTFMLKDINPGAPSSIGATMGSIGNLYIFTADDGVSGSEPWVSDGTTLGTVQLKDINPGVAGSSISNSVVVGSKLYFVATSIGSGTELWVTDGSPSGTQQVVDLAPGVESSGPTGLAALDSQRLFFAAVNPALPAATIYFSDGTPTGTSSIPQAMVDTGSSNIRAIVDVNSHTFIWSYNGAAIGNFLWSTDGTSEGTTKFVNSNLVQSVTTGTGILLYGTSDPTTGNDQLWKTDGTPSSISKIVEFVDGDTTNFYSIYGITEAFGGIFFLGNTAATGVEPWFSDGTPTGTSMLLETTAGTTGVGTAFTNQVFNNPIQNLAYFGDYSLSAIWVTNGATGGTTNITSAFTPGSYTSISSYPLGLKQLFVFEDPWLTFPERSGELWVTDGTIVGTAKILPAPGFLMRPSLGKLTLGNKRYFWATDGVNGVEPWVTDGTLGGTFMLKDITAGNNTSGIGSNFATCGNNVIFSSSGTSGGIWYSDGTTLGTIQLSSNVQYYGSGNGAAMVGGLCYFTGYSTLEGAELWVTDGTAGGTHLVKDIKAGATSSSPANLIAFNGKLFFTADDGVNGVELWMSDGTSAGTQINTDINPGSASSSPAALQVIGGKLYMTATKIMLGTEVWVVAP